MSEQKFRVTTAKYGRVHFIAGCNDCDFTDGIGDVRSANTVRRSVRAHVSRTGHSAWIESGTHTAYRRGDDGTVNAPLDTEGETGV